MLGRFQRKPIADKAPELLAPSCSRLVQHEKASFSATLLCVSLLEGRLVSHLPPSRMQSCGGFPFQQLCTNTPLKLIVTIYERKCRAKNCFYISSLWLNTWPIYSPNGLLLLDSHYSDKLMVCTCPISLRGHISTMENETYHVS